MNSYTYFSKYYDVLTSNIDYASRAEYFDAIIKKEMPSAAILLDLACGTGKLSQEFARLEYDVIGADVSPEMLSVASCKDGQDILYLCQSMDKLDLFGTIDVTVCALDSLNHIMQQTVIEDAFARVSLFTNPAGLFVFDVNTAHKHEKILGDNAFIYELDNIFCVWQNRYKPLNHTVEITLEFFENTGANTYQRFSERFFERIYSHEYLKALLEKNSFELLHVYAEDSFLPPCSESQRLIYVAKKLC